MRGKRRKGKGEELPAKFKLVRWRTVRSGRCPVPRVPKGKILSKTPSLNSKIISPSIVISK